MTERHWASQKGGVPRSLSGLGRNPAGCVCGPDLSPGVGLGALPDSNTRNIACMCIFKWFTVRP